MTISSEVRKAGPFNGNDVTTSFPFSFKVFDKGDLRVVRTMPSGIEADLILDSDYSVTLNPDQDATPGGTVTFPISGDPLAEDWKLTIVGDIDALQPTDLTNGGGFYPQVIENMSDRLTMLVQQAQEEIGRALKFPLSDERGLELPAAQTRANKVVGFDSNGDVTVLSVVEGQQVAAVNLDVFDSVTVGQTDLVTSFAFTPGVQAVEVYRDGSRLTPEQDYVELTGNTIRLLSGASEGEVFIVSAAGLAAGNEAAIAAYAAAAEGALYEFKGKYYGALSADPAVDPNGDPVTVGDLYFNTLTGRLRVYDAAIGAWIEQPASTLATPHLFSGDDTTDEFELTRSPINVGNVFVSIGGVDQRPGVDYQIVGPTLTTIRFTTPPQTGTNNVSVVVLSTLDVGITDASNVQYRSGNASDALDKMTFYAPDRPAAEILAADLGDGATVWIDSDEANGGVRTRNSVVGAGLTDALPDDAGMMRFIQSGTGAVPRTVQDKLRESVSVVDFGARGDGVSDDYLALQSAADFAELHGATLDFIAGRTYRILGSTSLTFKCSVDFRGATLDISDFNAQVVLSTAGEWEDDASALLAAQASGGIGSYISGWRNLPSISEHFIRITTSQYLYQYRGSPVYRVEDNLVTRFGQLASPFKWPLSGDAITKVEKLPFNKSATIYRDAVFYIGSREMSYAVIIKDASNIKVQNIGFEIADNLIYESSNPTWLLVIGCGMVEIDGLWFISPPLSSLGPGYAYSLQLDRGYDITIRNAVGQGDGWGANGSNFTQKVTFEKCNLSRVDFHHPFKESLKVRDSTIGNWGITVTALGDLILEDVKFVQSPVEHVENRGFIRSRIDTGGFCDGSLIARNVTLHNDLENRRFLADNGSSSEAPTSATPVDYVFWKSVVVDGLGIFGETVNLAPGVGAALFMKNPLKVSYRNVAGPSRFQISENARPYRPHNGVVGEEIYTGCPNYNLSLSDCSGLSEAKFVNNNAALLYRVAIENCSNSELLGTNFQSVDCMVASVKNSSIESFNFYNVSATTKKQKVCVTNCVINHTGAFSENPISNCNGLVLLSLIDSFVRSSGLNKFTNSNGFTAARLINVKVSYGSTYGANNIFLSSTSSFTLPENFNFDNKLCVATGYEANYSYTLTQVPLHNPRASTSHAYFRDGSGNISVTTGASRFDLTISSSGKDYRQTVLLLG